MQHVLCGLVATVEVLVFVGCVTGAGAVRLQCPSRQHCVLHHNRSGSRGWYCHLSFMHAQACIHCSRHLLILLVQHVVPMLHCALLLGGLFVPAAAAVVPVAHAGRLRFL